MLYLSCCKSTCNIHVRAIILRLFVTCPAPSTFGKVIITYVNYNGGRIVHVRIKLDNLPGSKNNILALTGPFLLSMRNWEPVNTQKIVLNM